MVPNRTWPQQELNALEIWRFFEAKEAPLQHKKAEDSMFHSEDGGMRMLPIIYFSGRPKKSSPFDSNPHLGTNPLPRLLWNLLQVCLQHFSRPLAVSSRKIGPNLVAPIADTATYYDHVMVDALPSTFSFAARCGNPLFKQLTASALLLPPVLWTRNIS